jgi:hypothetical protein
MNTLRIFVHRAVTTARQMKKAAYCRNFRAATKENVDAQL